MAKEIILPAISSDFEAGTIESWNKAVGDQIEKGEAIVSIETDKATIEVEATDSGKLGKIICEAGSENVAVNTVIGLLLEDGESVEDLAAISATQDKPEEASVPAKPEDSVPVSNTVNPEPSAADSSSTRIFASPLARRIAAREGIDLAKLSGRGPNGRILKADVDAAIGSQPTSVAPETAAAPQPESATSAPPDVTVETGYVAIPNNNMRKTIARRLGESKREVPHFYLTVNCELDALLTLRKQLNADTPEGELAYKLSVNDFVIKAAALALKDVPAANASWTEAAILQYTDVDVAVAVATPGGLITPIVRKTDTKGLATISNEVKDLAARAKDGKLKPEEYQGGGFTISNLGMFGVDQFNAIVNPPQSCILAIGAGEQRPIVKDGELTIATQMTCTLSVDHRSVDGAVGAQYLQAFKRYIEQPLNLMLRGG